MKTALLSFVFVASASVALAQEPQRPAPAPERPAGVREGATQRPAKPPQEFLAGPEWTALVEAIITQCPEGDKIACAARILNEVLNNPKATPASKEAAAHLMNRVKNAQESLANAKDEEERGRIHEGMRGRFVKARMALAQNEEERARIAARKEVEAGRMSEEQFNEMVARQMAAREELKKRLGPPPAPRAPGNAPAPRPTGGGRG